MGYSTCLARNRITGNNISMNCGSRKKGNDYLQVVTNSPKEWESTMEVSKGALGGNRIEGKFARQ